MTQWYPECLTKLTLEHDSSRYYDRAGVCTCIRRKVAGRHRNKGALGDHMKRVLSLVGMLCLLAATPAPVQSPSPSATQAPAAQGPMTADTAETIAGVT